MKALIALSTALWLLGAGSASSQTVELFFVRNIKKNQLHYRGVLKDCRWTAGGVNIEADWVMAGKDKDKDPRTPMDDDDKKYWTVIDTSVESDRRDLSWRLTAFDMADGLRNLQFVSRAAGSGSSCSVVTTVRGVPSIAKLDSAYYQVGLIRLKIGLKRIVFYGRGQDGKPAEQAIKP